MTHCATYHNRNLKQQTVLNIYYVIITNFLTVLHFYIEYSVQKKNKGGQYPTMPTKQVVDSWGFLCIDYELDADNNITKIWCKTCREFYEGKDSAGQKKGVAKLGSETYIKGTKIIKKNNFTDHVKSSITHKRAVLLLTEKANITP